MIFISLPLLYDNLKFNNFLKTFIYSHQKKEIFNIPMTFDSAHGSLPFSYWNGDVNNNWGTNLPIYNDIQNFFKSLNLPARINCSNILLCLEDLEDIHQNIILDAANNCGNLIEFSDLGIYNYIKEKYKNYFFVVSDKIDLIHPLDEKIINTFLEQDDFYLFNLPSRFYNDEDFLKSLNNKFKVEINIGLRCKCNNIDQEKECILQEQHNQIEFSGCSVFQNCPYISSYYGLSLIEDIKKFSALGFSHFKIETPPVDKIPYFNNFLIENIIKEEYRLVFKNDLLKFGGTLI